MLVFISLGAVLFWLLESAEVAPANDTALKSYIARPAYDPVTRWGQSAVDSATTVMAIAEQDCTIYEEGFHTVVKMKMYLREPNQRLQYVRSIAEADLILRGTSRNFYFYDPADNKIAQADALKGVRLSE